MHQLMLASTKNVLYLMVIATAPTLTESLSCVRRCRENAECISLLHSIATLLYKSLM